jgi:hypothetical protein
LPKTGPAAARRGRLFQPNHPISPFEGRMSIVHRRRFVQSVVSGLGIVAVGRAFLPRSLAAQAAIQKPPPLDLELVKSFVGAAHAKLDEVKSLLEKEPRLVNATWDWGGGDFETALGGASHMGRADIAAFLLSKGARMDVFCAAMMGKVDVVSACLDDDKAIVNVKGPHGISLLRHAQAGKQDIVVKLLTQAGAT